MLLKRVQSCHPTPLTTLSEVTIGMGLGYAGQCLDLKGPLEILWITIIEMDAFESECVNLVGILHLFI